MKIEGRNPVLEALKANKPIEKIMLQDNTLKDLQNIINLAKANGVKTQIVPKKVLDADSVVKNHQGVIAYTQNFKYSTVEEMLELASQKNEAPFLVLVDEVSDPHNLGSIIRSAECAGVHGIVIPKNRACQVNETVIKVSTGAVFNTKIACVNNINDCIRDLKKQDIWVFSMEANGKSIYNTDLTLPLALVVGSEGFGVKELTKKLSDEIVSLPMKGQINSLNASVAAGIGIYEVLKQRLSK